jgi:hypothetical protein
VMVSSEELSIMRKKYRWAMDNIQNKRHRYVLRLRWDEQLTLEEVGKEIKVTRERVRQLETKAIEAFYAALEQAPDFTGEIDMGSTVLGDEDDQPRRSFGAPAGPPQSQQSVTAVLEAKTSVDIQREIDALDKQYADITAKYEGRRGMLLVLKKALDKRDNVKPVLPAPGGKHADGTGRTIAGRVYDWLKQNQGASPKQIIDATGLPKASVYAALQKSTQFKNVGHGAWATIDA